jgi:putative spermidine/putrescine transport system permease protein
VAFTGAFFLYPLLITFGTSLEGSDGTGYSFSNYREILSSAKYWYVIGLTVFLGAAATAGSIAIAIPLALVLRWRQRGHHFVRVLTLVPLVILALIGGLGLLIIFSDTGWAGKIIGALVGERVRINYTIHGLVIFYVWLYAPYTILTTLAAIESINPDIEEAARVAGASPFHVLRRITIPLSLSGVRAGSILTFLLAFEAFGIPLIAGGEIRPLAVEIYTVAAVFNHFPKGSALAIIMAVVALAVLLVYEIPLASRRRGR